MEIDGEDEMEEKKKKSIRKEDDLSCNSLRGYRFSGFEQRNGERKITCNNVKGSCQHKACSCDKQLALTLQKLEETWDIRNHMVWGGFDREEKCKKMNFRSTPKSNQCCGDPDNRYPFNNFDGMRQCCGAKTFWKSEGCCINNKLTSTDQCPKKTKEVKL